jgi:hypothetical protein
MAFVGASGLGLTTNTGRVFIRLAPRDQRPGAAAVIASVATAIAISPAAAVSVRLIGPSSPRCSRVRPTLVRAAAATV